MCFLFPLTKTDLETLISHILIWNPASGCWLADVYGILFLGFLIKEKHQLDRGKPQFYESCCECEKDHPVY